MNFDRETGEVLDDAPESRPDPEREPSKAEVAHLPTPARVRELEAEVKRLEGALVESAKRESAAKGQLSDARGERNRQVRKSPFAGDARRVFEYWQEQLEPDAREFTDARFDNVVTRLSRGATVEELCEAIDGCKAKPYVGDNGRCATGTPEQRHTSLALICKSEDNVLRFRRYAPAGAADTHVPGTLFADAATREEPRAVAPPAPPAVHRVSPLDRAVLALRDEFGVDRVSMVWDEERGRPAGWWSACPIRPNGGHAPMKLVEVKGHGSSVFFACAHGCVHEDLAEAVRQIELRHDRRSGEAVSRARAAAATSEAA